MQIKICGMRDAQNIKELLALNPDFIGFIFYPASKRYITIDEYLSLDLDTRFTKKVGVFVNEDIKKVISIATLAEINYLQLHGDESVEYCEQLKYLDFKIIKAFGIDEHFDFQILNAYDEVCDYFLFDTKTKDFGGSGITFDWNILNNYTLNKKIFLSGGLNIEHIKQIKQLNFADKIFALDFNSQLEISPSNKDIKKCEALINAIHQLQ
jgi:phosphoribosylanthranilate isomerase